MINFSSSDFMVLRWNLAAICASILLSSSIWYASQEYAEHAQTDFIAAQQQMQVARERLTAAQLDRQNLASYAKDYRDLEQRNILGDDHRLSWIEGLEKLRQQNLVLDFRYNIAPQKNYPFPLAISNGSYDIHYSEMKLQFDLLHEEQLLNFLNSLHQQIKGYYQLTGCTILRNPVADLKDDDAKPAIAANLKAECSGGWVTLKHHKEQP